MLTRLKNFLKRINFILPLIVLRRRIKLYIWSLFNLPREVEVPLKEGVERVTFDTRDWLTANFCKTHVNGNVLKYESNRRRLFDLIASKSKIFFDVGTQIGFYAILAAKLGVLKNVGFDIDGSFLKVARRHAQANGLSDRIEFVQAAIGSDEGRATARNVSGESSMETISLDSFCSKRNLWPDFLKLDIEGFELEALMGAAELLKRGPVIILELHPPFLKARGKSPKEVFQILRDNNYEISLIDEQGSALKVQDFNAFLDSINVFLCVPRQSALSKAIAEKPLNF